METEGHRKDIVFWRGRMAIEETERAYRRQRAVERTEGRGGDRGP